MSIYLLERHRRSTDVATTDFLQAEPHHTSSAPLCEACGNPIGLRQWEPPFRVELETWGLRFGDLAFGPADEFLVSERFKALWEEAQLVGLHGFQPVEIIKVRERGGRVRRSPPAYFRVQVKRSAVAADQFRSGIQWMSPPTCNVCRVGTIRARERIVLESEPTENIFFARGLPGQVLVDEHVRSFCERHAIANCDLAPAELASRGY